MTFANINGNNIHYQYTDNQSDTTFIFINSLGTDFRIWDGVVDILKSQGNVLRYDKAGHGLSSDLRFSDFRHTSTEIVSGTPPDRTSKIENYVNDVIGLMDYLNIKKAVIVGLSIGGIIAQYLAVHHAERVERLILSNTAPKVGSEAGWNTRIETVKKDGIASISDNIMKVWFSENFRNNRKTELLGYKSMLSNTNPEGYIQACEALKINDLTDDISKINLPTLCIAGTEDGSTPPAQVKAMADLIPNSRYILIEGVGHIPCVEVPELIAEHILKFTK
ncbi:MAG: 3-oxoadipate enol-lactonase [Arcicella sp.]|nr:3-oxoadipate enol-lactonase [Arcicella sp.]